MTMTLLLVARPAIHCLPANMTYDGPSGTLEIKREIAERMAAFAMRANKLSKVVKVKHDAAGLWTEIA